MVPLRREWEQVRAECDQLWLKVQQAAKAGDKRRARGFRQSLEKLLRDFGHRLETVSVLDPACGSGNFLYVAINLLLDLEKQVISYASQRDFSWFPLVRPSQLAGIEINPYAQQLAQVVIWIGYLQWMHHNGFKTPSDPVLEPIDNITQKDAIVDLSDPENPKEPDWPEAEFIVGNPPFLGNKLMRSMLGERYCEAVWQLYGDRLPAMSDLCCYWFEKARAMITARRAKRAGLLATAGIKQVGARRVLERISETCCIFFAESDRDWTLDGAALRISMIGFDSAGGKTPPILDGSSVPQINADLTGGVNTNRAKPLAANAEQCFMGTTKVGAFDIQHDDALRMLHDPNPHGKPNSDVLRPWVNGSDIVRNPSNRWIIDFGTEMPEMRAAQYSQPFQYLTANVKQARQQSGQKDNQEYWWIHARPRPALRLALTRLSRYIGTARVAKHRIFVWLDTVVLPDSKVIAIASDDDRRFGVLHSRVHEVWSLALCGWHGKGNDATYNPNTCFLTFPFPTPTDKQSVAIAAAAKELDTLRSNWLNPPEWTRQEVLEFPGALDGPWARYVNKADARGIGTVRYPRIVPRDEDCARKLQKRTLTNLYNERPVWLDQAHKQLDAAVFAAYGWKPTMSDEEILAALLTLNQE